MTVSPLDLSQVTDHPLINVDATEYQRITSNLDFYRGVWPDKEWHTADGRPKKRDNNALNFLQSACDRFASLLYNENCTITIDDDDAQSYIDTVLNNNRFNSNFQRYLASMLAMGGLAIRPYWDDTNQQIKLAWIQAPNFYPLRNNTSEVSEAAISSQTAVQKGNTRWYYTLLEIHQWSNGQYVISNQLFRSESKKIVGKQVPLSELYDDLPEQVTYNSLTEPLFVYIKPAKFNNIDVNSPLGVGFADNTRSTLREINDTYDQLGMEIKLGQRRIAISGNMAQWIPDKSGNAPSRPAFDPDDPIYVAVDGGDKFSLTDLTPALRSPQYQVALATLIKTFEVQNGLSVGTFSLAPDGDVKTATQVVSENSATYQTRNSYLTNIEYGIKQLIIAILELSQQVITSTGATLYTGAIPDKEHIAVNFDDGVFVDKAAQTDTWIKLYAAKLATQEQAIAKVQGVTEEQAAKIAAQIKAETPEPPLPQFEEEQGDEGAE
ncbi:MAG: phage portal protein [Schleiferilactobacillus perolens]|uniref:phage portal protein n=1 Tax=Schleiferilactobacillus perolens TaxID=100468 RepID=UPI0039ECE118